MSRAGSLRQARIGQSKPTVPPISIPSTAQLQTYQIEGTSLFERTIVLSEAVLVLDSAPM
jgi:hypothetical protein